MNKRLVIKHSKNFRDIKDYIRNKKHIIWNEYLLMETVYILLIIFEDDAAFAKFLLNFDYDPSWEEHVEGFGDLFDNMLSTK